MRATLAAMIRSIAVCGCFAVVVVFAACGSSANVPSATCNACVGASYTDSDCQAWGQMAGCKTSTFVASVPGCINGCSFTDCDQPPNCGAIPIDAGQD
jgi:hypothetical protein